jgi:hypothetical protein
LQLDIQEAGEVSAHLAGETQRKQHCFKPWNCWF